MITGLEEFPVVIEIPVAWGETDAFHHVNNIIYIRYFESSRIAYMMKLDWIHKTIPSGIGPILHSVQCRFKYPLTFPDTVSVGARVTRVESDRFLMEHRIVSHSTGKVAAYGEGMIVTFDYDRNAKAAVPDSLRERILALEGRGSDSGRDLVP